MVTAIQGSSRASSFTGIEPEYVNYITKISELAAKILATLNQSSQEKTHRTEEYKADYKKWNNTSAAFNTSIGNAGFYSALTALATTGGIAVLFPDYLTAAKMLGEQLVPSIGNTWTTNYQKLQAEAGGRAQISLTQFQNTQQQQQSEGAKQEILSTLQKALEALTAAARG